MLHHVILILHVLKMFSSSANASGERWHDSLIARTITRNPERLARCWCVISVHRRTFLKRIRLMLNMWQIF